MGITEVTVEVSNPRDQTHWQKLDLIADTGAIFSVIPKSTLDQLGISPYAEETFTLADGSEIRRLTGDVFIRIDGKAKLPTRHCSESRHSKYSVTQLIRAPASSNQPKCSCFNPRGYLPVLEIG
jgi:predicted aspartyl protease